MGLNLIPKNVSEQQKETYLLMAIMREYEKQDKITDAVNIPYFIRARQKVDRIIQSGELDKKFKEYKEKEKKTWLKIQPKKQNLNR